jgi:hypothetical protein
VFNTYGIDERDIEEQLANPMIIDIGLTTGNVPNLDELEDINHY